MVSGHLVDLEKEGHVRRRNMGLGLGIFWLFCKIAYGFNQLLMVFLL